MIPAVKLADVAILMVYFGQTPSYQARHSTSPSSLSITITNSPSVHSQSRRDTDDIGVLYRAGRQNKNKISCAREFAEAFGWREVLTRPVSGMTKISSRSIHPSKYANVLLRGTLGRPGVGIVWVDPGAWWWKARKVWIWCIRAP